MKNKTKNILSICTQMNDLNMSKNIKKWNNNIYDILSLKNDNSILFLSIELLPRFLNSKIGFALINILRMRELDSNGNLPKCPTIVRADSPLRTVAYGLSEKSEDFWFEMFKVLSEHVPFGMHEYFLIFLLVFFFIYLPLSMCNFTYSHGIFSDSFIDLFICLSICYRVY